MPLTTYINSTDVRKDFSATIDNVIHNKPQFIQRTHNHLVFIEEGELNRLLSSLIIPVKFFKEEDGTYIATNPIIEDVFATGTSKSDALNNLCNDLIEYAEDYYSNYELYSRAPNRRAHAPYVMRILSARSAEVVKEMLHA